MRTEITRMVADWLIADVNTRIAAVPVDAGDESLRTAIATYSDPAYPATTIGVFDDTRHPWVAEAKAPPVLPALYVRVQGVIRMDGEPGPDGQIRLPESAVQVAVRYLTSDEDHAVAIARGNYTLRAVARSLRELSRNSHDAQRNRNGIWLVLGRNPLEFYPVVGLVGAARIAGAVVVNYEIRDEQAQY